ncbi:MAG: NAD(P)H-dependent glycerol-3-phosphate dehydrogenase [Acetobacterales bacterium]
MRRLAVVGSGAWGTALAVALRRASDAAVVLWAHRPEVAARINAEHCNPDYLPDCPLDPAIRADSAPAAIAGAEAVLLVVPAQFLRGVLERLAPHWPDGAPAVICAKGIEQDSGALMTDVVADALPGVTQAVLSGPTFAREVAAGLPTAVTLACTDADTGHRLIAAIGSRAFRPYLSDDLIGAEIGGATKNVLAIACGIVVGRQLGDNARAALITRGLAEIARLGAAKGASPATLMGLAGLGDLTLTCNGPQSRNMSLGMALGEGRALADILAGRRSVAEGVASAPALVALAGRLGIEMPICAAVAGIVDGRLSVDEAIEGLLTRPLRSESDEC